MWDDYADYSDDVPCDLSAQFVLACNVLVHHIYSCSGNGSTSVARTPLAPSPLSIQTVEFCLGGIASGKKTIEGIPGAAGEYDSLRGRTIEIHTPAAHIDVKVTDIRYYSDLMEYIETEHWCLATPSASSLEESLDMHSAAYPEDIIARRGGFVALSLQPVGKIIVRQK